MDRLAGTALPALALPSTAGGRLDLATLRGRSVVFFYPYSGRPGVPDPPGWDTLPGAHGSTPQAQAYSRLYSEFRIRDVKLFGVSLQDPEWQRDFAERNALPFALLSDHEATLSGRLQLPVFRAGEKTYLKRLTLIVKAGIITAVRYPVTDPAGDAAAVLGLLDGPAA